MKTACWKSRRRTIRACRIHCETQRKSDGQPQTESSAMKRILAWFDARLSIRESLLPLLTHPIPKGAAGPMGWWYVFGSASLTLFIVQILTGVALSLVFVSSADQAYESLLYLNFD